MAAYALTAPVNLNVGSLAAEHVFARCHGFKKVRINAVTDPAQMIGVKPEGYRTLALLVHPPVDVENRGSACSLLHAGVTRLVNEAGPQPATVCAVDLGCDALFERGAVHASVPVRPAGSPPSTAPTWSPLAAGAESPTASGDWGVRRS